MNQDVTSRGDEGRVTPWSALGDWVRQTTLASSRPGCGQIVSVLVCTAYQTFFVARLLFAGGQTDGNAYVFTQHWQGALTVAVVTIGAAVLLIWRSHQPLTVLLIQCMLYAVASAAGMSNYLTFPLLFALFSCVARPPLGHVITGVAAVWAVMTFSAAVSDTPSGGFATEYPGQLFTMASTIAVAVATRSVAGWWAFRLRARQQEQHSLRLERQRDHAISRTRIAAELHDSVGHGLTTIIALAEGLSGSTGDPTLDEALDGINTVARASLEETRQAVRALTHDIDLHDSTQECDSGADTVELHDWSEIQPVLANTRALGTTVVFTETGRRSHDPAHADLCFSLTREAITNAIRHSPCVERIAISWDHDLRTTTVIVRNTTTPVPAETTPMYRTPALPGTGLLRLARRIEKTGGTLNAGWEQDDEWTVKAVIPTLPPRTDTT